MATTARHAPAMDAVPVAAGTPGRAIVADLVPLPPLAALGAEWLALQAAADHSFFQSWGWIGCWLECLPESIRPVLLRVRQGDTVVGLAVIGERTVWRRGFIRSRIARLNETGFPEIDKLAIEHNGVLVRRDCAAAATEAALACLARGLRERRWDEVLLSGVGPDYRAAAAQACDAPLDLVVRRHKPSYLVDLGAIRDGGGSIPEAFRAGLRKEARRALRHAERFGPLAIEEAASVEQALAFLTALVPLHEARWTKAGELGAFFSPWLRRFHPALIESRHATGDIQLLRISVGDAPIGYLYHFRHGGRIYAYQWGLAPEDGRDIRRGLVCDILSMRHNLEQGVALFDFLHGESAYKRRFATGFDERFWLTMQRPRLDFRLETAAHGLWRRYRRRASAGAAQAPDEP